VSEASHLKIRHDAGVFEFRTINWTCKVARIEETINACKATERKLKGKSKSADVFIYSLN